MVFSEPAQILACLETIARDREVEVVRVNNKLARSYDAGITACYRCAARIPVLKKRLAASGDAALRVHGPQVQDCRLSPSQQDSQLTSLDNHLTLKVVTSEC